MAGDLHIETYTLGPWATNCYVLYREGDPRCWVVDAGFEPTPMLRALRDRSLVPDKLVLTHAHPDHIAGVSAFREVWPNLPILIHAAEKDFPPDPQLNLSAQIDVPIAAPAPTETLAHGDVLELSGLRFEIRHTPGHSPGGITLYQPDEGVALVGDALFAGAIGRVDFPGSDGPTLLRSIHEQLLTLPDDTRIYPGHMGASTIGEQRRTNPFLQP